MTYSVAYRSGQRSCCEVRGYREVRIWVRGQVVISEVTGMSENRSDQRLGSIYYAQDRKCYALSPTQTVLIC